MDEFEQAQAPEPRLARRAWGLIAAALVIWSFVLLLAGQSGVLATLRTRAVRTDLEEQVAVQAAENERLREEIRRLRSDKQRIEAVAREELMMARPDELVLLVPDPTPPRPPVQPATGGAEPAP